MQTATCPEMSSHSYCSSYPWSQGHRAHRASLTPSQPGSDRPVSRQLTVSTPLSPPSPLKAPQESRQWGGTQKRPLPATASQDLCLNLPSPLDSSPSAPVWCQNIGTECKVGFSVPCQFPALAAKQGAELTSVSCRKKPALPCTPWGCGSCLQGQHQAAVRTRSAPTAAKDTV